MRTKSGVVSHRKRVKIRKAIKGMQHARRSSYRMGKQAVVRSLQYAYRDRRVKKREFRKLWITRINAAARKNGTTYSKLTNDMKNADIIINRQMLALLAYKEPDAFKSVVEATTNTSEVSKSTTPTEVSN